jgi:hypothetical protein
MKTLALIFVILLFGCASTRKAQEKELLLCDNIAVLDAKIVYLQKTVDKMYAHERLMELRQYEQIHVDKSLTFDNLVVKP